MKRFFGIFLLTLSASALAQGNACNEPEYYFIKNASKAELRDQYCYLKRKAESNESSLQITKDAILKKKEMQMDVSHERDVELSESSAARSCRIAAISIAGSLERRFKLKPPSCN